MENKVLRKRIIAVFQLCGFTIKSDACDFLTENLVPLSVREREEWLDKITDHCQRQPLTSTLIDKVHIESAIIDSCKNGIDEDEELITVISAFEVPKFTYNLDRKKFLPDRNHKREIYGSATSKGALFKDRYTLIFQRTLRNKLFHGVANDTSQHKLRPVEFLLSTTNTIENVVLLGMLTQLKEGRYYLEDPTGIVQLNLSSASYHDGLFADSCFVLAEGSYQDGVMTVQVIGLPPRELAEDSRVYYGMANYFGGPSQECLKSNERLKMVEGRRDDVMFIFISDCWLDQPRVIEKLKVLFAGYSQMPPMAFIMFGNFLSSQQGSRHLTTLKEAFTLLGDIISLTPNIAKQSKFIIIPGPTDSPLANILPRPELPDIIVNGLKNKVSNVIMATNPCRIQYCTQEIVAIREDLVTKLCRNSVHFPALADIEQQFAKTIICQGHLVPLSLNVCPVYWDFDAGLQLYPCPDLIIVAEQQKAFTTMFNHCQVVNPGPFSKGEFNFKVYYPANKEVEDCQIPEETI